MLKAASGGGGIGIDLCYSDEDCRNSFEKNRKKKQQCSLVTAHCI